MLKFFARALVLSIALGSSAAFAQAWPSKAVRIIIATGPAGITDIVARVVADELSKRLGQPFIVENRTGGNSSIAARAVKNAPPDGYTLFGGAAISFSSLYLKDNSMDASKELQPVSIMALGDNFVVVRSELGVSSLKELAAKARTTRLKHASPSPPNHALMALVAKHLGFDFDNIPYKTSDQVRAALLSGEGDFSDGSLAGYMPHIQSGKIRVLAILSPVRSPLTPNVPTAKEQGLNIEIRFTLGLWAPLGTPREIVAKLGAAVSEAVKTPAVAEKINAVSMIPTGSSPEELVRALQSEVRTYQEANALIGLQPQ